MSSCPGEWGEGVRAAGFLQRNRAQRLVSPGDEAGRGGGGGGQTFVHLT